jgi:hypothetical protein
LVEFEILLIVDENNRWAKKPPWSHEKRQGRHDDMKLAKKILTISFKST